METVAGKDGASVAGNEGKGQDRVGGRKPGGLRISVARNEESFSFIYEEHLEILREMGSVSFFDPEKDVPMSRDIDLLYLPGGILKSIP